MVRCQLPGCLWPASQCQNHASQKRVIKSLDAKKLSMRHVGRRCSDLVSKKINVQRFRVAYFKLLLLYSLPLDRQVSGNCIGIFGNNWQNN